jgi:hypothetical protein
MWNHNGVIKVKATGTYKNKYGATIVTGVGDDGKEHEYLITRSYELDLILKNGWKKFHSK